MVPVWLHRDNTLHIADVEASEARPGRSNIVLGSLALFPTKSPCTTRRATFASMRGAFVDASPLHREETCVERVERLRFHIN